MHKVRILNGIVRLTSRRLEYEADQRHTEIIVHRLELEHAGVVSVFGAKKEKDGNDVRELEGQAATGFRVIAARANYLA